MEDKFPLTTKAEQEEIALRGLPIIGKSKDVFFRKHFRLIEIEYDGKKIRVSPFALLAAVRVICGEQNKN